MTTNRKPLQKYNPGSLDETDTESLKMGINEELWEISTNFMQTDEILGDAFEKIDTLEIDRDNMNAKIEETYRMSVADDKVLSERISEVSADLDTESNKLSSQIVETNRVVSELSKTTSENKLELESSIASASENAKTELEKAQTALDQAIKDGDTAEAERLRAEVARLQGAIDGNKADIEAKLSVTNTTVAELNRVMAENKLELESSIGQSTSNSTAALDKAKADLEAAIAAGDTSAADKLKDEVTRLEGLVDTGKNEVLAKAEADLKAAQLALNTAIANGDEDAAKKLQAEVDKLIGIINANKTDIEAKLSVTNTTVANMDKALSSQITSVEANFNGQIAGVNQTISAQANKLGQVESKWGVTMNSNGKVSGVSMNNNGSTSTFSVVADKFSISDGTNTTNPPFQVVGGHTRIMSAFINTMQSDNWDGANNGWAITNNGWAHFNNVTVRGTVYANAGTFTGTVNANAGTFNNITINENCTVKGTIFADKLSGSVSNTIAILEQDDQTHNIPATKMERTLIISGVNVYCSGGQAQSGGGSVKGRMQMETWINGQYKMSYHEESGSSRGWKSMGRTVRIPANTAISIRILMTKSVVSNSSAKYDMDGSFIMAI